MTSMKKYQNSYMKQRKINYHHKTRKLSKNVNSKNRDLWMKGLLGQVKLEAERFLGILNW